MQIQYDINRSLKVNPPKLIYKKDEGIEFIRRDHGHIPSFIKVDPEGNSLNPRKKEVELYEHDGLTFHLGVLYDKELMVVELREDGELELISGFGRCHWFQERDIDTFMVDVVKFTNRYYKHLWKIRFNASKDHTSKGIPNTEATLLKGLDDAKRAKSFDWKNPKKRMDALRFMTNGSKSDDQLKKLDKKWCKDNPSDETIRALTTNVANKLCKNMNLPYKGYVNDASLLSYNRIGFNISRRDDIDIKIVQFIELYENFKKPIELYGFIQHVVAKNIAQQRYELWETWNESIDWMNKYFPIQYKNIVQIKGFHAQLRSPNPDDGGKPTERGIIGIPKKVTKNNVDTFYNGKIIIDLDPPIV